MIRRFFGRCDPLIWLVVLGMIGSAIALYEAIRAADKVSTLEEESALTRITTVTQRCQLTLLDSNFAGLVASVVARADPKAASPFMALSGKYTVSYHGCERQLTKVIRIARAGR